MPLSWGFKRTGRSKTVSAASTTPHFWQNFCIFEIPFILRPWICKNIKGKLTWACCGRCALKTTDIKMLTICVSSSRNFSLKHKIFGIHSFYFLTHVCKKLGCTSKYSTWGRWKSWKIVTKAWHFDRFSAFGSREDSVTFRYFISNLPDRRCLMLDSSPNFSKIGVRNSWDNERVSANFGNNWVKGCCAIWDSKSLVGVFWISRFMVVWYG